MMHTDRIPELVSMAIRHSLAGRPGPSLPRHPSRHPVRVRRGGARSPTFPPLRFRSEAAGAGRRRSVDRGPRGARESANGPVIFAGGGGTALRATAQDELCVEFADADAHDSGASRARRRAGASPSARPLGFGGFGLSASRGVHNRGRRSRPDVVLLLRRPGRDVHRLVRAAAARCFPPTRRSSRWIVVRGGDRSQPRRRDRSRGRRARDPRSDERARRRGIAVRATTGAWIDALVAGPRGLSQDPRERSCTGPNPPIHPPGPGLCREIAEFLGGRRHPRCRRR